MQEQSIEKRLAKAWLDFIYSKGTQIVTIKNKNDIFCQNLR